MNNPCIKCLVRPACTLICKLKEEYQDRIICDLTEFSNEYLYDEKGNYRNTALSKEMTIKYRMLLNRCDNNSKEFQRIFSKGRKIK